MVFSGPRGSHPAIAGFLGWEQELHAPISPHPWKDREQGLKYWVLPTGPSRPPQATLSSLLGKHSLLKTDNELFWVSWKRDLGAVSGPWMLIFF